jgi:hypothetical protein
LPALSARASLGRVQNAFPREREVQSALPNAAGRREGACAREGKMLGPRLASIGLEQRSEAKFALMQSLGIDAYIFSSNVPDRQTVAVVFLVGPMLAAS